MADMTFSGRFESAPRIHETILTYLRGKWTEHRLLRSLEAMPYEVQKDVGFRAAGRANES